MSHPWPLFCLFSSIQTNLTIFKTNVCEKCPSGIQYWDSNLPPSGHESPSITTRPGHFVLLNFLDIALVQSG